MTENEQNAFDALVNGELAELAETKAPEVDPRKDGIYYYAEADTVSVYHVVVDHRIVAYVRIDNATTVEIPEPLSLGQGMLPGTTGHAITITSLDGSVVLPTGGITIKAPEGIFNRSMIKFYVIPRLPKLLVRLYRIGL